MGEFFEYIPKEKIDEDDDSEEEEEQNWKKKYINQKELNKILLLEPFKLSSESAYLLSRYVVED